MRHGIPPSRYFLAFPIAVQRISQPLIIVDWLTTMKSRDSSVYVSPMKGL